MRIAVTSQNFKTITGHAGKTRRFVVYETDGSSPPLEVERLDLPKGLALHDYHGADHPLFGLGLDALVTQGAGPGFLQRLARYGIRVYATSASDPLVAVAAIASGQSLPPAEDHHHGMGERPSDP